MGPQGCSVLGWPPPRHCRPSLPALRASSRARATREKGLPSAYFLSSPSATDRFHKGSVKTIVKKRIIFPSTSRVGPSMGGGGWRALVNGSRLDTGWLEWDEV